MLWVLIRIASPSLKLPLRGSSNCLCEAVLMSTNNICFYREIWKTTINYDKYPPYLFLCFAGIPCIMDEDKVIANKLLLDWEPVLHDDNVDDDNDTIINSESVRA